MRRSIACAAAFVLATVAARPAHATGFETVVDYVSGGRWRDAHPDSLIAGFGHYVGYDYKHFAAGAAMHFYYSPSFGGDNLALELGAYARANLLTIELDRHVNIMAFLRFDGYYRTRTALNTDGFVPYLHLGLRVGGIEVTTGGALETLQGGHVGGMLVWSLGVDIVELASTIAHQCRSSTPQPP